MNFETTNVTDVTIYGLSKVFDVPNADINIVKYTCDVEWHAELETRNWGIKGILVYATKIVASIEWEVYTYNLTEEEKAKLIAVGGKEYKDLIGGLIEIVSNAEWNRKQWTVDNDNFGLQEDGFCCPCSVEINFEDMNICVS